MVGEIFRLRWDIELFYKTAKSGSGLNELPSTQWMTGWNQLLVDCLERLLLPPARRSAWS